MHKPQAEVATNARERAIFRRLSKKKEKRRKG